MMDKNANETDVREEIATPFLKLLGYERGTGNDISREQPLSYDRAFLGRKKPNDPPLRGRADYILTVLGAGRWVLETKAPSQEIDKDSIDQAMTYARHPEIGASYTAILNGHRFVLFHISQSSSDTPLVDVMVSSGEDLARQLIGVLSPTSIKRDCSPPVVDLNLPLFDGFRSEASVDGGEIKYTGFSWRSNLPIPPDQVENLNDLSKKMIGFHAGITGGGIYRDNASRIRAKITWAIPHDLMHQFAIDKKLLDTEFISLDNTISLDREKPTCFDFIAGLSVSPGEEIFNMLEWKTNLVGIETRVVYSGRATGWITNNTFTGVFSSEFNSTFPLLPNFHLNMYAQGVMEVRLSSK